MRQGKERIEYEAGEDGSEGEALVLPVPSVALTVRIEREGLGWKITCLHCGNVWPVNRRGGYTTPAALASVFRHAAALADSLRIEERRAKLRYSRRG